MRYTTEIEFKLHSKYERKYFSVHIFYKYITLVANTHVMKVGKEICKLDDFISLGHAYGELHNNIECY